MLKYLYFRYVVKKYHFIQYPENLDDMAVFEFKGNSVGGTLTFKVQFHRYMEMNYYIWADEFLTGIFFEVYTELNQNWNETSTNISNGWECVNK